MVNSADPDQLAFSECISEDYKIAGHAVRCMCSSKVEYGWSVSFISV